MVMYAINIFYWRKYRVNYAFIFGFKPGTELGYKEVFLLSFGLGALALASVLSNLDMEMDPKTKDYKTFTELLPLNLILVRLSFNILNILVPIIFQQHVLTPFLLSILQFTLIILFLPFNILYRSSRFFLLTCLFHCICAPLYKVN